MAFAIASKAKVYPIEHEDSMRRACIHAVEVSLTAAASDTSLALGTIAAADTTYGTFLNTVLQRCEKVLSYNFLESARATSASGTAHSYTNSASNPTFVFAGGSSTPTALTLFMLVKLKKDMPYVKSDNL